MSLRIVAPSAVATAFAAGDTEAGARADTRLDSYMERLVKLVPVESISAYPLLSSYAGDQGLWAEVLVSWLLLLVSGILRWKATQGSTGDAQITAIMVALVSFIIWVGVMDGHFGVSSFLSWAGYTGLAGMFESSKEFLMVIALVIWTILVPVFYKGDPA
jgi:hypothetical protein